MSGVTRHIYDRNIQEILTMWEKELKSIRNLLPPNYSDENIIEMIKTYYPHEWKSAEIKFIYYKKKDKSLINLHKKPRYTMPKPEELLRDTREYSRMMDESYRKSYASNFDAVACRAARDSLWEKRKDKIKRIDEKIEKATSKTQMVTPQFINQMIGLYERKGTSQKDKVYILAELKKYYNDKVIWFFFKINDTELNRQLREEAFYHLQSFNYHPRLRKQQYMQVHTKNRERKKYLKNVYANEVFHIAHNPDELEYRIRNSKEQGMKSYDFFISHSSKDSASVQKLISYENRNGRNVFCDWLCDSDYLKRNLLCDATVKVLEVRLEQSKAVIFVDSDNSRNSVWCKYELNYFHILGRPIYIIKKKAIDSGNFSLENMESDTWYLDNNYRQSIKI